MHSFKGSLLTGLALFVMLVAASCATDKAMEKTSDVSDVKVEKAQSYGELGDAFMTYCREQQQKARAVVGKLKSESAGRPALDTLTLMNEVDMLLDDTYNRSGLRQYTHPDKGIRDAAMVCEQELVALDTEFKLDHELYLAFNGIDSAVLKGNADSLRYLDKILREFRRNGVDKDEDTRKKITDLKNKVTEFTQIFDKNLAEDTRFVEVKDAARLKGLPQDFIDQHKPDENGVIKISTDWPDYYPVIQYADDDELRRELWMTMMNLGYPKNTPVFKDVLKTRRDLSNILGYKNWAWYATEEMMIKSPDNSIEFVNKVSQLARPSATRDVEELLAYKKKLDPKATAVNPWERAYLSRLVSKEKYDYSQEEARPYFDMVRVRQGILDISSKLYGIEFKRNTEVEVWHESVEVFDVLEGGVAIGRIYLDLYPRDNKYKSFAMFPMVPGVKGIRISEGAIVGNFPDPAKSKGAVLIDHYDVVTFFHEFGHLMHHILSGKQAYMRFSGTSAEWDFVEVPSQLYEEWAWDYNVLKTFAIDDKGNSIPEEMVKKMVAADKFGKGLFVQTQMYYAALSHGVYVADPETFDTEAFAIEMENKYAAFPHVDGTHFIEGFSHLIGYSSNYYTYMWSLVIEKDIVAMFKNAGMLDTGVSLKYRSEIISQGGRLDAAEQVRNFMGRDFSFDAFKVWLEQE